MLKRDRSVLLSVCAKDLGGLPRAPEKGAKFPWTSSVFWHLFTYKPKTQQIKDFFFFSVKNEGMAYFGDLVDQLSNGLLWSVYFFWAETKPFLCRLLKSHPIITPSWLLVDEVWTGDLGKGISICSFKSPSTVTYITDLSTDHGLKEWQ